MKIGELAKAAHVEVETVRYYERIGLLPAPARSDNGYRVYAGTHLERLAFIRHCRALDITLADVARLLRFVDDPAAQCAEVNTLIDTQLARVRARLDSLRTLERQLTTLRSQCGTPNRAAHCGILHELEAPALGDACVCHGGHTD
ncbi:MerR family transcriptional regulator [Thauera sp. 28]|uniref:Cd(II)/Pb(II)-responsive transcriptional regulator n=1 Tax=Thauera sp. 28 TaxID=303682 RepID=UPI0002CE8CE0|nr:Cd(II)/Pb(II)-responsive transcriptional regulator [Thauera sp. 28]ENO93940.1 MerR family transcriptional regulator [Thauera sp. 28]